MKRDLRKEILKKRDGIRLEEKKTKEAAIRERLFALSDFKDSKCVLFYASLRSEVDTLNCITMAIERKKKVLLPRVDPKKRELRLFEVTGLSELAPGYMGIPEPDIVNGREKSIDDADMVVMPGVGFDIKGNRLGYGAGYYDKLLGRSGKRSKPVSRPLTIALAFEDQIVEQVPSEPHDIKVDLIITEDRLIRCRSADIERP